MLGREFWLLAFGLLLISDILYKLYLHPCARYPGPLLGRLTDFYHLYLFATKKYHERLLDLHKEYGPLVRIGPNLLSFSDPSLLHDVYYRQAEKTRFYSTGLAGEVAPLLQIQAHREHRAKLKTLATTYSMGNLMKLEPVINERILETAKTLKIQSTDPSKKIDLAEWVRYYVYDTITSLLYGKPVGMIAQGFDIRSLIESWHDMFTMGGLVATLPWLVHPIITSRPWKKYLMPQKGQNWGSGLIMTVHDELFTDRLRNPQRALPGNLFDSFLQMKSVDGRQLTLGEAKHECFLLTVAAQDTTAGFITPLINFIISDKRIYREVLNEINQFSDEGLLSNPIAAYNEIIRLPYWSACCAETLRLLPPTPIILPRLVREEGINYRGSFIPAGVEIGANPYVIHRDREVFGLDSDLFRPERWLESAERTRFMQNHFLAWGQGSRKCIGKNIALVESQKLVFHLLREFEIGREAGTEPWKTENWGINVFWDFRVELKPRQKEQ